jgi:hypothetical protein
MGIDLAIAERSEDRISVAADSLALYYQ